MPYTDFHYTPTGTGVISGKEVLEQTEDAINDLGTQISGDVQTAIDTANNALNTANSASADAQNAVNTANTAYTAATNAQNTANAAQTTASNALTAAQNAQNDVNALGNRVTTAENNITQNTSDISGLTTRMGTAEGNITNLQNDVITAQGSATSAQNTATLAREQAYVTRYAATSVSDNSTVAYSDLNNTDNIKIGDFILDVNGKLFAITAVDTANETVSVTTPLTQLAVDANVMHLSGDETVTGTKTFSGNTFFSTNVYHKHSSYESGNIPANNLISNVYLADKNNVYMGYIRNVIYTSGRTGTEIRAKNTFKNGVLDPTGDDITSNFNVEVQPDGTKTISWDGLIRNNLVPFTTGNNSLGTSANKWKTMNGINPGALSFPDLSSGLDISGYITVPNTSNTYTPTVDGWISIILKSTSGALTCFIYQGDHANSNYSATSLPNETEPCVMCSLPVVKNVAVTIDVKGSNAYVASAKFYPCQGNI